MSGRSKSSPIQFHTVFNFPNTYNIPNIKISLEKPIYTTSQYKDIGDPDKTTP